MSESHTEEVVYRVVLDFSDAEKQQRAFEQKWGRRGRGSDGGASGGGSSSGNTPSSGPSGSKDTGEKWNFWKVLHQFAGSRGGGMGTSANSVIGQKLRGFGLGGNGAGGNFFRHFLGNLNNTGFIGKMANPGFASWVLKGGASGVGGASGMSFLGKAVGGAALRGLGGAIAGSGGAALAGAGPVGLAALAVVASAKNMAKVMGHINTALASFAKSLISGDASQALHGLVSYTQAAAQAIGGPILGDVLAKIIGTGHQFIDLMDSLVKSLGRFSPIVAAQARMLEVKGIFLNRQLASVFQPVMSAWIELKSTVMDIISAIAPLAGPTIQIVAWLIGQLNQGLQGLLASVKLSTYGMLQLGELVMRSISIVLGPLDMGAGKVADAFDAASNAILGGSQDLSEAQRIYNKSFINSFGAGAVNQAAENSRPHTPLKPPARPNLKTSQNNPPTRALGGNPVWLQPLPVPKPWQEIANAAWIQPLPRQALPEAWRSNPFQSVAATAGVYPATVTLKGGTYRESDDHIKKGASQSDFDSGWQKERERQREEGQGKPGRSIAGRRSSFRSRGADGRAAPLSIRLLGHSHHQQLHGQG